MINSALIVFVKNPEKGKVKTRIADTLGEEKAFKIYEKLLDHTHEIIQDLPCAKYIFYSDFVEKDDMWDNEEFFKEKQNGSDLGSRMSSAFEQIFNKDFKSVIIIGSDCFELRAKHIENAVAALKYNDIVIGPATDGGYYLLGMNKFDPEIFKIPEWSTPSVASDTFEICKSKNLQVVLLPTLSDVDVEADVKFSY